MRNVWAALDDTAKLADKKQDSSNKTIKERESQCCPVPSLGRRSSNVTRRKVYLPLVTALPDMILILIE